jgi:tetratricopeptide (TPR) repeat protein
LLRYGRYTNTFPKKKAKLTASVSGIGISAGGNITANSANGGHAVIAAGNVVIGITLEHYEAGLKRREKEVRNELLQANAADKGKLALLEKQLIDVQAKIQNPEAALEDYKKKLDEAYRAFDDLKQEVLPEQIKLAQANLTKGETGAAEKLFIQMLDKGKENAAEAAYQLAELAKNRIDYVTAGKYYQEAATLQPNNALYFNDAGFMAYTQGDYAKAEPLFQRSLAIREKALGKDHSDVAGSLINLAVLYQAQGDYAKAEPLHQRSLAISEKALGPDHPDTKTVRDNLQQLLANLH